MFKKTLIYLWVLLALATAASAGPVLDDILNYMFLDQGTSRRPPIDTFEIDRELTLTKEEPIGQTFVTGPETDRIVRIQVQLASTPDWKPGEGAEMVVWDSPAKKTSYGRYIIWFEFRGYHWKQAEFEVNARVKPNTTYYFEISYAGNGDGRLGRVGVITGRDGYKAGQGYQAEKEAEFDLALQTHCKKVPDRIGNLRKAFARFDLSSPELSEVKAAVDKEDFDTAESRLVSYFEAREKLAVAIEEAVPKYKPDFDTRTADQAMINVFETRETDKGYAGPDLNWRAEPSFDERGYHTAGSFELNRFGVRGLLTSAYASTGNEKYAKKFNDMMIDWFLDNPYPPVSHIGGSDWDQVWSSLNTGIRLGQAFVAYSRVAASPYFTTDCRFAWILSLADHADTLLEVGGGADGNWAFTQNNSLMTSALNYPEYANSKLWFDTSVARIDDRLKKDFLPDGVEMESSPGYQRFAYKPLLHLLGLLQERKVQTPFLAGLKALLEKQAEYFIYMNMPDGTMPVLGDTGNNPDRAPMLRDAEFFNRKDILYVGTAGKQGIKPKELSKAYPHAGIATMRSDWGDTGQPFEDARYLMLHGVHYGSHGHADLNGVTIYGYGRELIADPGGYIYGSVEHLRLMESTSHNLMTIDGQTQKNSTKGKFETWMTTPVADYLSSRVTGNPPGDYVRDVFYVRSAGVRGARDYWMIRDTAYGTGTHSLELRWHFLPGSDPTVDKFALSTTTTFPAKGNISILQVDPTRLQVEQTTIDMWRGIESLDSVKKMPTVIYKTQAQLPSAVDTVLFPFEGRGGPKVQVRSMEKSANGLDSAFKVIQGNVEDLFVLRKSAGAKSLPSEKVSFNGECLLVRRVNGRLQSLVLINGTRATVGGQQVVKLAKPAAWVAVSFDRTGKKVYKSAK